MLPKGFKSKLILLTLFFRSSSNSASYGAHHASQYQQYGARYGGGGYSGGGGHYGGGGGGYYGGGGYGDPLDRDPEKVRAGVLSERISRGRAEQVYGVILSDSGEVDPTATETLRQKRRAERVATA